MSVRIRELLSHRDFFSVVLFMIVCGSVWGFIEIADALHEGELRKMDLAILNLFRRPDEPLMPIGPYWLREMMRDATALGGVLILTLLVLFTAIALWIENHYRAAIWLAISSLGALGLSTVFKQLFARERPTLISRDLLPDSYGFPSGHSMLSAAVYLTVGALLARVVLRTRTKILVLFVAMVLTVLTGLSRIYLAVHYPSDVLGGWTLGLAWAAICWLIAWNIKNL